MYDYMTFSSIASSCDTATEKQGWWTCLGSCMKEGFYRFGGLDVNGGLLELLLLVVFVAVLLFFCGDRCVSKNFVALQE